MISVTVGSNVCKSCALSTGNKWHCGQIQQGTMNLFIMEMGWGEGILFLDRIALPYLTHLMFVQFIILCHMLF